MKKTLYIAYLVMISATVAAQQSERTAPSGNGQQTGVGDGQAAGTENGKTRYWNEGLKIVSYRLPPPPVGYQPEFRDLDGDGDPDVLLSMTIHNTPVMWIDDDDDMTTEDWEGDTDSDCLLIDRNKDGEYGGIGDLIVDWVANHDDNNPDMQVIVDYPAEEHDKVWPYGHYMWVLDTDNDDIFNYIDWNDFHLKAWDHNGTSDFYEDYSGQSLFLKVHAVVNRIENLKLNWENPFLFYEEDDDGLSEMAIRLIDSPRYFDDPEKGEHPQTMRLSGKIDWVSIAVDLDNDNAPGTDFDFDFTIGFRGEGFDYMDQVHRFEKMKGLPESDQFFLDSRWRQMDELIYPDHENAPALIFGRGKWSKVYFVYDEDDDCHRWERVEFLDPKDPFKVGTGKGGIDNNSQSDAAGDRGEWDLDNSGKGRLYISRFDGRMHLQGAELGYWRIDQNANFYQGWDRRWLNRNPENFATVKYEDADNNGFFDKISYDMDGDTTFEEVVDLKALGIDDRCQAIDISGFNYKDYTALHKKISDQMWDQAQTALKVAAANRLNIRWYAKLFEAETIRARYNNGYWIQFYIYRDLRDLFQRQQDTARLRELDKAYYGANWKSLLK